MGNGVRTHRDLQVWQERLELAELVCKSTARFPADELFGLTRQMRRAAVSIVSNLSEGAARESPRDFARFLRIARGSAAELDSQLVLAVRLGFLLDPGELELHILRVGRMLTALHRAIKVKRQSSAI